MNNDDALLSEISFIKKNYWNERSIIQSPDWLRSDFHSNTWDVDISVGGKELTTIDFNVFLNDGNLLTHPKHAHLLESIKSYICLASDPINNTSGIINRRTLGLRVQTILHTLDYFLLRSSRFEIAQHYFDLITEQDIAEYVSVLASGKSYKNNLFRAREEICVFIRRALLEVTGTIMNAVINEHPEIAKIDSEERETFGLIEDEIVRARVYLWINGFYRHNTNSSASSKDEYFVNQISPRVLMEAIFHKRIFSCPKFVNLPLGIFHFNPRERRQRECAMVPCQTNASNSKAAHRVINQYLQILSLMPMVKKFGLASIDERAISVIHKPVIKHQADLKDGGRIKTLPHEVTFTAVRHAIEFFLGYGKHLLTAYRGLASLAHERSTTIMKLSASDFQAKLPVELIQFGVKVWDMNFRGNRNKPRELYYARLRANEGLIHLIDILYASIFIILGTLTARRVREILELRVDDSLIKMSHGYYMSFDLRKRNLGNLRETVIRPIPNIVADCIETLQQLQYDLRPLGKSYYTSYLFSKPINQRTGLAEPHEGDLFKLLDKFSDYFELPLDDEGRRYYIRPHQLRRFFAMTFFWSKSYGGLDTLRWYLGHTNIQHVYHYITETIPGEVLHRVEAEYAAQALKNGDKYTENLRNLIQDRYGVFDFSIMQSDEVADYLEDLICEGTLTVEPIFFETPEKEQFEIMFKIRNTINDKR